MSSKRSLYKPAPQEIVLPKTKRALIQGRLVSDNDGQNIAIDHDARATISYTSEDMSGSPRNKFSEMSHSGTDFSGLSNASVFSPRRSTPMTSEHSPKPAHPTRSLDLTESSDEDISFRGMRKRSVKQNTVADVVVVDASRQTSPGTAEVDIRVGLERSPVRVICHVPAVVESNIRNTGDTEQARHIQVDYVPSITVISGTDVTDPTQHRHVTKLKSPLVVRESAIAGSPIVSDTVSKSIKIESHLTHPIEEKQSYRGFKQPADTVHTGSTSLADTSCLRVNTSSVSETRPASERKKKGRFVPSRYKQAAAASKTETIPPRNTSFQAPVIHKRHDTSTLKGTDGLRRRLGSEFSATPMVRGPGMDAMVSSTPATSFIQDVPPNVSAIPSRHKVIARTKQTKASMDAKDIPGSGKTSTLPKQTHLKLTNISKDTCVKKVLRGRSPAPTLQSSHKDNSLLGNDSILNASSAIKRKENVQTSQRHLDLLYNRYLQWLHLDTRQQKTFKEQEKKAMAQMWGLWEENEKLKKRLAHLDEVHERVHHTNELDNLLDLQLTGLSGITGDIPMLKQQYSSLAEALDTTRHHIPTRGVYIPDNEDVYQEQLLSTLRESEQLLGELSVMIRQEQPKISSVAKATEALNKSVKEEVTELDRCQEALAAVQTLATQETSMMLQHIQ